MYFLFVKTLAIRLSHLSRHFGDRFIQCHSEKYRPDLFRGLISQIVTVHTEQRLERAEFRICLGVSRLFDRLLYVYSKVETA